MILVQNAVMLAVALTIISALLSVGYVGTLALLVNIENALVVMCGMYLKT